jgi:hypothetical protein
MGLRARRLTVALAVAGLGLIAPRAHALDDLREFYRGTRAVGMGGAFTAVADDEQAIFFNPAGLAGIKGFTFNYAAVDIEASQDIYTSFSAFTQLGGGGFSVATLNQLMGKRILARAQVAPSLVMKNFGIAPIVDGLVSFNESNQTYPKINFGYQFTNGIQAAYGFSLTGRKKRASRHDFRVGLAGKLLFRRGGYRDFQFYEILALTQDYYQLLTGVGNYGMGYGGDIGTQYLFTPNKRVTLAAGLAFTDIGDTAFASPQADPIKSNLSVGLAATYQLPRMKFTLAWDQRHLLQDSNFAKRNHVGVEAQFPFISLFGGVYQLSLTYGASFDIWVMRITAASYAEDYGAYALQDSSRRYNLRLAFKFGF